MLGVCSSSVCWNNLRKLRLYAFRQMIPWGGWIPTSHCWWFRTPIPNHLRCQLPTSTGDRRISEASTESQSNHHLRHWRPPWHDPQHTSTNVFRLASSTWIRSWSGRKGHEKGTNHIISYHTVDGSEIRRAPVEVGSWHPIIYRVPKTSLVVVWGFFHQQYHVIYIYISCIMYHHPFIAITVSIITLYYCELVWLYCHDDAYHNSWYCNNIYIYIYCIIYYHITYCHIISYHKLS